MSDLAKNAPDPNDKEATGRYFVQLELENLKDGAIQVATLGAGKLVAPAAGKLWCKIAKTGCFAAGTPVPVQHGCKAVEAIRKGDRVFMRPENDPTAPPILGEVVETFKTFTQICELQVGGRVVRTTVSHPFWVRGKGWTAACDLRPSQELRTEDGWVRCGEFVTTGESEFVYNFTVAEGHTYFVGDPVTWGFALWNHNAATDCANAAAKAANRFADTAGGRKAYSRAVAQAEKQYPKLAGKIQQHHIEPKYMGGAANGATTPVNAAYHQQITNAIRDKWAYGQGPLEESLRKVFLNQVYTNLPLPPG
jgi:hypothetical protein